MLTACQIILDYYNLMLDVNKHYVDDYFIGEAYLLLCIECLLFFTFSPNFGIDIGDFVDLFRGSSGSM